jgi:transposase-like protein
MKSRDYKVNAKQEALFNRADWPVSHPTTSPNGCEIVSVGKRRDGGTRYWCLSHKADATAKYGRPAKECRYAHVPPLAPGDVLHLDADDYEGGIALWGAVPPVYDTTRRPLDRGIHVHARKRAAKEKEMDRTYRSVRLYSAKAKLPSEGVVISELDAIYYMVTVAFGYKVRDVVCSLCGHPHLDKDWFSVHPHQRHLCAGCGRHFRDTKVAIGNPISRILDSWQWPRPEPVQSGKKLKISQADYPGGVQIWGSNPSLIWTGKKSEEIGIHVHAFKNDSDYQEVDDTFSEVIIDGIALNSEMVRTLMVQRALPHIADRVVALKCPRCGAGKFDQNERAYTPASQHACSQCGASFQATGRLRNVVSNPIIAVLDRLASNAPRPPQNNTLDLIPETL